MEALNLRVRGWWAIVHNWLVSPQFYLQIATIAAAVAIALAISWILRSRIGRWRSEPTEHDGLTLRRLALASQPLYLPLLAVLLLGVAVDVSVELIERSWLVRIAQSLAIVILLYRLIVNFIGDTLVTNLLKWVGIPLATLHVFGWLDGVIAYLDRLSITIGSIHLSAYAIGRAIFFGIILFWLGRVSNSSGKQMIRNNPRLDTGAREVLAKLFEIGLFVVLALVLLQVMGIGLTALTVFGGAFGIGLGLGLQRIAANFISGIIILLDRSLTIDDYIELEDGRSGRLRELNMRSATLETFDGKDIVVPNETFVSTAFTNWTHFNSKQRYELVFGVAYGTDIPHLVELVKELVASHPQVLSGPDVHPDDLPDCEIKDFGDSAILMLVEFWIEGIDDGPNRVGADLRLMIWSALRQHGIEMPFPQREVRIVAADDATERSPAESRPA